MEELNKLLGEIVFRRNAAVAAQCICLELCTARRATNAEVDPIRIESVQSSENFGYFERAVMRKQHTARTDSYIRCLGADSRYQNFRSRTGQGIHGVMLGDPVTRIAEPVRQARQLKRVLQCVSGRESR